MDISLYAIASSLIVGSWYSNAYDLPYHELGLTDMLERTGIVVLWVAIISSRVVRARRKRVDRRRDYLRT